MGVLSRLHLLTSRSPEGEALDRLAVACGRRRRRDGLPKWETLQGWLGRADRCLDCLRAASEGGRAVDASGPTWRWAARR